MRTHITVSTLAAVLVVSGLAGCGSNSKTAAPSPTSSTTASPGAEFDIGNAIDYGSFGTITELDCGDGKSLNVGGSNNTLTVKGTCSSVHIAGMDNKITFDRIDKDLSVGGFNNAITYKAGDPKVNDIGSGNTVTRG
jgi:hypothetical protein